MYPSRMNKQTFDKIFNLRSRGGFTEQMKEDLTVKTKRFGEDFRMRRYLSKKRERKRWGWRENEKKAQQSERMKEVWRKRKEKPK